MSDEPRQPPDISWARAVMTAVVVAVVATALLAYVPDLIVRRWTALVHSARVAITVGWFFVALAGLATAMRWLQRKRVL